MTGWALDVGTTNSGLCRWDAARARPELVELPAICRLPGEQDPLLAPRLVPSCTHILSEPDLWRRLHRLPVLRNSLTLGRYAHIGRAALEHSAGHRHAHFVPHFKSFLARAPLRPIARCARRSYNAREVAWMFLRELLGEVERATSERLRELVVSVPVDSYEAYRTELSRSLGELGVRRVRFVDEPVAAAFGYGLGLTHARLSLVVDFGGGTLDMALVRFSASAAEKGHCDVVAKAGRPVGGNLVDLWLLEDFCAREDLGLARYLEHDEEGWLPLLLAEARRVKETLFFAPRTTFDLVPPDEARDFEARLRGETRPFDLEVDKATLERVLQQRGLPDTLLACLAEVDAAAQARGVSLAEVEDVLMVGGSVLLPGVFPLFEAHFGRDRVRAWQPFEAVAHGAVALAADRITRSDHIVHDYAIRTRDAASGEPRYSVIVPRGTGFPSDAALWKQQLIPSCARGEPESYFKLVICEIGRAHGAEHGLGWDERGQLHRVGGAVSGDERPALVVPLNEHSPTLGTLDPPHAPSDRRPRLEVSFGINAERWLVATVYDLHTRRFLLQQETVVRLL